MIKRWKDIKPGDVIEGWNATVIEVTELTRYTMIVCRFPDNHLETYDVLSTDLVEIRNMPIL